MEGQSLLEEGVGIWEEKEGEGIEESVPFCKNLQVLVSETFRSSLWTLGLAYDLLCPAGKDVMFSRSKQTHGGSHAVSSAPRSLCPPSRERHVCKRLLVSEEET